MQREFPQTRLNDSSFFITMIFLFLFFIYVTNATGNAKAIRDMVLTLTGHYDPLHA